jgi:hypothetical protein
MRETIGVNHIEQSDESEYLESLKHDRHMFAWCLVAFGNVPGFKIDTRSLNRHF